MKYDCFDMGLSTEGPLTHRRYKCKICKEYFKPSFQVNALWRGYYLCDHIKFCFEHTGEQILNWFQGHIKYDGDRIDNFDRKNNKRIVELYLEQQAELDFFKDIDGYLLKKEVIL